MYMPLQIRIHKYNRQNHCRVVALILFVNKPCFARDLEQVLKPNADGVPKANTTKYKHNNKHQIRDETGELRALMFDGVIMHVVRVVMWWWL
jgi:hypothetical protein